jgi:hypothetical protein
MGQTVPSFRQNTGGVEICHREFITDITGSIAFSVANYNINPGLSNVFPWLAAVAENFEEYEMKGLVFEFRPTSGSAVSSTSSALGTVILATDYNVLSPNFLNKQQMESYEFSTSVVPFNAGFHPVECAPGSNPIKNMYIRNTAVPSGADARLYDLGNFQVATVGMQSAYVVGELWVTYHILMKKPRSFAATVGQGNFAHFINSVASSGTAGHPWAPTAVATPETDLVEVSIFATSPDNGFVFSFPGSYMLVVTVGGTGTLSGLTLSLGSSLAAGPFFQQDAGASVVFGNSALFVGVFTITVGIAGKGPNNVATITMGAGNTLGADLYVYPIPANLY